MCFSATASFSAGAVLLAIGTITVKKSESKAELPFAMIPLLFGVQQLIEGVIWLTFQFDAPLLNTVMTYLYTLFSHVLWPVYIPFAVLLLEPVHMRRKMITAFFVVGMVVGVYLLYILVRYPVTSEVVDQHIVYLSPHFYALAVMGSYLAASCVSMFFSSYKVIVVFGIVALLSFIAAYEFYTQSLISVWCFFAAILSGLVYLHINRSENLEVSLKSTLRY